MKSPRERAKYTNNAGPIGFGNPSEEGPLDYVSYCIVDGMINILLRRNPFPGENSFFKTSISLEKSTRNVKGNGCLPYIEISGCNNFLENTHCGIWFAGALDLEDMVQIVEGVPELEAGWLRPELDKLKYMAALESRDYPHLDSDINGKKTGFYRHSWFSAKGGTMYFAPETPRSVRQAVRTAFNEQAGMKPAKPNRASRYSKAYPALRFLWAEPYGDVEATRAAMLDILKTVPGVLQSTPNDTAVPAIFL